MIVRRLLATLVAATALFATSAPEASARTVPCTGDRLVQVVDGPGWRRDDGLVVNIGYLFPGCFGAGRWIGYIGESSRYIPLSDENLRFLAERAGLAALPLTPSRLDYLLQAFVGELIGLAVLLVVLGWHLLVPARRTAAA